MMPPFGPLLPLLFSAVSLFGLQGCASHDSISVKNTPASFRGDNSGIDEAPRTEMGFSGPPPKSAAFVGLALSGGGSRAANFSLAVMEELNRMGLLEQVNAISTVSGGSVAGAYFALHSDKINWPRARTLMVEDFITPWAMQTIRPDNLLRQFWTDFDRSDIMASVLDEKLFGGATFSNLGPVGPGRPKLFINATNANGKIGYSGVEGVRFVFDNTTVRMGLQSDIGAYPIASAVMASAAFPGVFNRVTLERFERPLDTGDDQPYRAKAQNPRQFIHLMDGGPADNLGIETLLEAAFSHFFVSADDLPSRESGPCLLILADAYQSESSPETELKSDPRSALDHFIDTDFFDSISVMLAQRREDMLKALGIRDEVSPSAKLNSREILPSGLLGAFRQAIVNHGSRRTGTIDLYYRCRGGGPEPRECDMLPRFASSVKSGVFTCKVWHLSLTDISGTGSLDEDNNLVYSEARRLSNLMVSHIVDRISTNFRLTGPNRCGPRVLQAAIYQAAAYLTRDLPSVKEICDFSSEAGIVNVDVCMAPSRSQPDIVRIAVEPVSGLRQYAPSEFTQTVEQPLECITDEDFAARAEK
ncbi:patatin-like phospholipase family protein [Massilia sp. S19_KUP03_FR1]|uniref:patatin-like phospholipase family protein n=1 Tax=Massilia sp. S19_KUP03_FR1 TaxID=3025503 RepID=UPI002FCD91CF